MREKLVVLGLGYAGMPLVRLAGLADYAVTGYDIDIEVVKRLRRGRSNVPGISHSDVEQLLQHGVQFGHDERVLSGFETAVICVPTPLDTNGQPDLSCLESATECVARYLRKGSLVVVESTSFPGTTDGIVRRVLETRGLEAGRDFHLASSPERIDPGNTFYGLKNTPKIVGGHTATCAQRAASFYGKLCDRVVVARGTREAEMAKLIENTYRHVNIALVNEMAMFCRDLDIDIHDALDCAATKPFGFHEFRPGPGVGGHCIPVDPMYLAHRVRSCGKQFALVEVADEVNRRVPNYVVKRIEEMLVSRSKSLKESSIALLGVTYKADVSDTRNSPATSIGRLLRGRGARLAFHDPFVMNWRVDTQPVERLNDLRSGLERADLSVLLQNHKCYDEETLSVADLLLDTKGALKLDAERL